MANLISVSVFQNPDGTNESPSLTHLIPVDTFQSVTAKSTTGISGVNTVVSVKYYKGNNRLTGDYLVNESVAAVLTAANA